MRDKSPPPKAYVDFKKQITSVLERLLQYSLNLADEQFRKALQKAEMFYSRLNVMGSSMHHAQQALLEFWAPEIQNTTAVLHNLARASYVLSKTGEIEALARSLDKLPRHAYLTKSEVKDSISNNILPGKLEDRVAMAYEDMAVKIAKAIRISNVLGESGAATIKRMRRYYPPERTVYRGRKPLAKPKLLREAADDELEQKMRDALESDFYDQDEWEALVQTYKEMELWEGRFGDQTEEGIDRYKFQFEQEATEEFVNQVRSGEIQAAKEQGIDDFIWSAIIDKLTCTYCCEKRDGLLTSDIEHKLKGPWSNDECQAVTPPAHPNCRCQVLPVSSDYVPKKQTFTGIDEWLNDQGEK